MDVLNDDNFQINRKSEIIEEVHQRASFDKSTITTNQSGVKVIGPAYILRILDTKIKLFYGTHAFVSTKYGEYENMVWGKIDNEGTVIKNNSGTSRYYGFSWGDTPEEAFIYLQKAIDKKIQSYNNKVTSIENNGCYKSDDETWCLADYHIKCQSNIDILNNILTKADDFIQERGPLLIRNRNLQYTFDFSEEKTTHELGDGKDKAFTIRVYSNEVEIEYGTLYTNYSKSRQVSNKKAIHTSTSNESDETAVTKYYYIFWGDTVEEAYNTLHEVLKDEINRFRRWIREIKNKDYQVSEYLIREYGTKEKKQ